MFVSTLPLVLHWGDISVAEELQDQILPMVRLGIAAAVEDPANEQAGLLHGLPSWAFFLHRTGLMHACDITRTLQVEAKLTYHTAHETIDSCQTPWVRPRGDSTMNVFFSTAEFITCANQMAHILMSDDLGVSREEVLSNLPTVDEVINYAMTHDELSNTEGLFGHFFR